MRSKMSTKFTRELEMATDSTLVEPNWESIIAVTDMLRSGEVPAKPAVEAIRKRLQHENPHVVNHTLLLLDACVKNCGQKMHHEIATREFMEDFKNLVTENKYDEVKNKGLEMLQCWATAFANKPEYKMIVDTHNLMKLAGFDFPSLKEADAMFMAQVAPEWQDGNECYRCRSSFSLFNRKHHCRACGQIFCDKCSSREMALPHFGIEKEVRVCETCYENKIAEVKSRRDPQKGVITKQYKASSPSDGKSKEEKEKELKEREEEELALALAISQSEAEAKEKEREKVKSLYSMYNGVGEQTSSNIYENPISGYKGAQDIADAPQESVAEDPLARYLNRDYWQNKKEGKVDEWSTSSVGNGVGFSATAPPPSDPSVAPSICSTLMAPDDNSLNLELAAMNIVGSVTNGASDEVNSQAEDTMKWCQSIREQVSVMDNRIRSNLARGRPVFNDSAIQDLFTRLTELHSHVLSRMHTLDEQRGYYESLQDHLANIGEARQAINEMREEHERKRQERLAEEQRQRQDQMQQTLEMMRIKKHAMLMEQREQALQRFQQQQQEMAMRRQQQVYYNPQAGYPQQQPQQQQYYGYQQPSSIVPPVQTQQPPQYYQQHSNGGNVQDPSQLYYQQQQQQHQPQQAQQAQNDQQYAQQQPQIGQYQQQQYYHQQGYGQHQYVPTQQGYQNGAEAQQQNVAQHQQFHQGEVKSEPSHHGYTQQQQQNVPTNYEQIPHNQPPQHQEVVEQPLISFD